MRRRVAGLAVALTLALSLSAGCGEVLAQAIGGSASDGGTPSDATSDHGSDGPSGNDGASSGDSPVDATGFCQGQGAVLPGPNPNHLCAGDLANLFKFAACACTSFAVSGVLTTASLTSPDGGVTEVASIGANQALSTNSTTTLGGSVWAAGAGLTQGAPAVLLGGTAPGLVAGDIQSGAAVEIAGPYVVVGDVWANGNVTVDTSGSLQVDGTVHVPPADTVSMDVDAGGGVAHPAAVTVAPPCDCGNPIQIANIVQGFETTNEDAANHLTPSSLDDPTQPVSLPCGLYYFDGIHGGSVSLDILGRVAVFVDGDLSVTQGITIELEAGAELDLFITGNVDIQGPSGSVTIGDVSHAALTRIYVGGSGSDAGGGFALSADATISANIYAPNAVVQLASDFVLRGAILAQALQFSGDFSILYDTAVLQVSQSSGCQPTGGGCATCNDCPSATPACNAGTCGPCHTTADCCAPLVCVTGTGLCELPTQ
jgi:hypothetical protein